MVPAGKCFLHLGVGHSKSIPHQLVALADQFYIPVFNPVVDHLDKVSGAAAPHPVTAGRSIVDFGGDGLEKGLYQRPCFRRAARHQGRPFEGAFLSAGNTGSDIEQALGCRLHAASVRVVEVGVSPVNDHIAALQYFFQFGDDLIHSSPCRHHKEHFPRTLQALCQFLIRKCSAQPRLSVGEKFPCNLRDIVVNRYLKTFGSHIEGQTPAHDSQADQADVAGCRTHLLTLAFPVQIFHISSSSAGRA